MPRADELVRLDPKFDDTRLLAMFPRYKAYNHPRSLNDSDRIAYEEYRTARLARQTPQFMRDLQTLAAKQSLTDHQQFVLEEMKLWYESVLPVEESYE